MSWSLFNYLNDYFYGTLVSDWNSYYYVIVHFSAFLLERQRLFIEGVDVHLADRRKAINVSSKSVSLRIFNSINIIYTLWISSCKLYVVIKFVSTCILSCMKSSQITYPIYWSQFWERVLYIKVFGQITQD